MKKLSTMSKGEPFRLSHFALYQILMSLMLILIVLITLIGLGNKLWVICRIKSLILLVSPRGGNDTK